jgi:ABC-2 type transport system permease protein
MSIGITLLEQILFFDLPYRSTVIGGALLTFLYSAAVLTAGYLVGSVIPDRTFASQIAAIIVLPTTILGGYTWPVIAMPSFFQQLAKIIPFYYYGTELRSLCLAPLKFQHLLPPIGVMCVFIAVETGLLYLVKRREAVL